MLYNNNNIYLDVLKFNKTWRVLIYCSFKTLEATLYDSNRINLLLNNT